MRKLQIATLLGCISTPIIFSQQTDPAAQVYERAAKSVFLILMRSASGEPIARGTGFLIAGNKIVTNNHVIIEGTPFLDLGAVKLPMRLEKIDAINDLAILSVDGELSVAALDLAPSEPSPGTSIFAIGNPAGLERSISSGVVAGIRQMGGRELVQISAPISPGSSGGPILNAQTQVVAVAVGILEGGQNLNFAVPIRFVQVLLKGEKSSGTVPTLLARMDSILSKRGQEQKYSADPDSPWMKSRKEIEDICREALNVAGRDVPSLKLIASKVLDYSFIVIDPSLAVQASERILQIKSDADSYLLLARSLDGAAAVEAPPADKNSVSLKKAEQMIRAAFAATKQPTLEMYSVLGSIMEERESWSESKAAYLRAYQLANAQNLPEAVTDALRGLIRTSVGTTNNVETDRWFAILVGTGQVGYYDRDQQARRLYSRGEYKLSGDNFALNASPMQWESYCDAGAAYFVEGKDFDRILEMSRACVANGADKKGSDFKIADAHDNIATVLNARGVYEEALGHARDAVTIQPQNAFYQATLADTFNGLRRFQEAINASKQAIRLSDGKYATMHFKLASAYFDIENWQLSRQSYEKAAELDPKDAAATYNVALCLTKLGLLRDAADWYEETLRRNPNHPKKQELSNRIRALRN